MVKGSQVLTSVVSATTTAPVKMPQQPSLMRLPSGGVQLGLALEVAGSQVSRDGVDGLPAHRDGAPPWRAQGEKQGQAESDHCHEPADRKPGPPPSAQGKHRGIRDQRRRRDDQDGYVKTGS